MEETLIIIKTFNNEIETIMAREKLEANGIYSFIESENSTGLDPLGGKKLKVFLKDKLRAEQIISENTLK